MIKNNVPFRRKSNIELLRVVAMLMILTLHTRFEGIESCYDGVIDANHIARFSFQALSIVGVNLFVLISGYFGIKLKATGLINLLWQIVYIAVVCIFVRYVMSKMGGANLNFEIKHFFPVTNTVWFVPSYIMLMVFSPILNSYVEKITTKRLFFYTLGLYALSYYWSSLWVGTIAGFDGYSWGWFVILYLSGQIIRRLKDEKRLPSRVIMLLSYLSLTVFVVVIAFVQNYVPIGRSLMWVYNSPLVYTSSVCLFAFFCQLHIAYNKIINWLAASAFAVLLFHMSLFKTYQSICKWIYDNYNGIACIAASCGFIIALYLIVTLLDQPRKFIFDFISKH